MRRFLVASVVLSALVAAALLRRDHVPVVEIHPVKAPVVVDATPSTTQETVVDHGGRWDGKRSEPPERPVPAPEKPASRGRGHERQVITKGSAGRVMTAALSDLFTQEQAERLGRLYASIEPAIPEGSPYHAPRDASHTPAAVQRGVLEIVGEDGLKKLREEALKAAMPPPDIDYIYFQLIAPPLARWWPFLKESP